MPRLDPPKDLVEQPLVVIELAVHLDAHSHARATDLRVFVFEGLYLRQQHYSAKRGKKEGGIP
jgi:hypothetical protein